EFQRVICQSEYVRGWVRRYWNVDAAVVNPPIDRPGEEPDLAGKDRLILSVGRFFSGGHSKRHDLLVDSFRTLCDGGLTGWPLARPGGAVPADTGAGRRRGAPPPARARCQDGQRPLLAGHLQDPSAGRPGAAGRGAPARVKEVLLDARPLQGASARRGIGRYA